MEIRKMQAKDEVMIFEDLAPLDLTRQDPPDGEGTVNHSEIVD